MGRASEVEKGRGSQPVGAGQADLVVREDLNSGGSALWRNRRCWVCPDGLLRLRPGVNNVVAAGGVVPDAAVADVVAVAVEGAGSHPFEEEPLLIPVHGRGLPVLVVLRRVPGASRDGR